MVWRTPPVVLPQDKLTAQYLNTYLRDNQLEMLPSLPSNAHAIAVTSGPNEVTWSSMLTATKTTTSTTTTQTIGAAAVGPTLTFSHNGAFLLMYSAEISSSSGGITSYSVGSFQGPGVHPTFARAARTSAATRMTCTGHVIHYNAPSPITLNGYLWTSAGGNTASVFNAFYTVLPL